MTRALVAGCLFLSVGCMIPPERQPLKPLPDDGVVLTYADAVARARLQATAAVEAFYVNRWEDLEDSAKGIEQTARFLGKATDVPVKFKDILPVESGDLGKAATQLREAAKAKDVQLTSEILQKINLKVRELRPQ